MACRTIQAFATADSLYYDNLPYRVIDLDCVAFANLAFKETEAVILLEFLGLKVAEKIIIYVVGEIAYVPYHVLAYLLLSV